MGWHDGRERSCSAKNNAGVDSVDARVMSHFPVVRSKSALLPQVDPFVHIRAGIEWGPAIGAEPVLACLAQLHDRDRVQTGFDWPFYPPALTPWLVVTARHRVIF